MFKHIIYIILILIAFLCGCFLCTCGQDTVVKEVEVIKYVERYEGVIVPRPATYAEVKKFIAEDQTDKLDYDLMTFNCFDFAIMVREHAITNGIKCGIVDIRSGVKSHEINIFDTTDKGLVCFDPQDDVEERMPEVGGYYGSPNFLGGAIVAIKIMW
jgi:hypothetical protein